VRHVEARIFIYDKLQPFREEINGDETNLISDFHLLVKIN